MDGINKSNVPVLIFHGTKDQTIDYNESAIINHRSEITNANVQYITLDGVTHSGMFYTKEAREYNNGEFLKLRRELYDRYNGEVPESELVKLYENADRDLMNVPNEELLGRIESFFEAVK